MDVANSRAAYIEQRRQNEDERKARAAEKLKNHRYTCLVNQDDAEIWRCKAEGTTAYAFDIMMTRFGIAVVGDIGHLTFGVGLSYGMKFLAGDDVTYYLHTKLNESHKKKVFSQDLFRQVLVSCICRELHNDCSEAIWDTLPAWAQDSDLVRGAHWAEFRALTATHRRDMSNGDDRWMHWDDLFDQAEDIGFTEEAHSFMKDNSAVLCLGDEWYEHRITETCDSLYAQLYMINHAAKAIMSQTDQPAA
ncbi:MULTISPECIES: hypothetical protein [Pseudomonas]|uniref:Uncharacterized protein n=4 Tax=Pseudomonas TaxID=286 RepID=A0A3G1DGK4_PSEAI|nr:MULTISPECIES: hypothetical protein [Pseudomonas]AXQ51127.1 hypothetical protein DZC31_31090 [Stenotrophomonas rhizophila]MCO6692689.1 hypothetical protein [Pseudomonas shirazica]AMP35777.1 Hypothetical protein [Pseudomonas aeruginosa]ESW38560.1 hypothetical protein O164_16975 [Pseudomonas taiwanensis SJ9]KIC80941.1 hypothetical protein RR51_18525 [Pseudomonas sp. C5pp]